MAQRLFDFLQGDAVVLGDADAASHDVAWRRANLHGEGARIDDGEPSEGCDVRPGPCAQAPDVVHALHQQIRW